MDKIRIKGGTKLQGTVKVSGAKNAALPLMTASLLTAEPLTLSNLPHLADITTMAALLMQHGVELSMDGCAPNGGVTGRVISLCAANIPNKVAPYDIVRKMRASVWVIGPLLARFGEARVSLPGGCAIGTRPIDMHLQAFKEMGATIQLEEGYVHASVEGRLKGAEIIFDKVSVGATANAMMAATLADGTTTIRNAAREPEVRDLAVCLIAMGAKIEGMGTDTLVIHGVESLHGAEHSIINDRIEAGTFAVAAAITQGNVLIEGAPVADMGAVLDKLSHTGVTITHEETGLRVNGTAGRAKSVDVITQPYPGFPTDMQAQFMALMAHTDGVSTITETIFENRFMHVSELLRMGADISTKSNTAVIKGSEHLAGAEVMATDLRASVSLIIAGLAASGHTIVNRVYHLDRGYERIEEKLAACGALIERIR